MQSQPNFQRNGVSSVAIFRQLFQFGELPMRAADD